MAQSRAEQSRAEQSRAEQVQYNFVDVCKFVMAIMVVALHVQPLLDISADGNFYLSGGITRLGVPYFFMASGFFLFKKFPAGVLDRQKIGLYCRRLIKIYLAWAAVYIPMIGYEILKNPSHVKGVLSVLKNFLLNGSVVYHLWYLYASVVAVWGIYFLWHRGKSMGQIIAAGAVLYLIPIFARGYYGVYVYFFPDGSMVNNVFLYLGKLFGAINGLTEGMLFMALGGLVTWKGWERCFSAGKLKLAVCVCFLGYLAELWFVYTYNLVNVGNSASFLLPPMVLSLFLLSIKIRLSNHGVYRLLRDYSLFIYLVHPWFLFICSGIAKKLLGMEQYHLPVFVATLLLSVAVAEVLRRCRKYKCVDWLG